MKVYKFHYIGVVHDKRKSGITGKLSSRTKSHDKGNTNPMFYHVYVAMSGYEGHILNLERHVLGELAPYLENPQRNRTPSEYVDPKYTHITEDYIRDIAESRIKSHPLKIMRLKKEFLPVTRYNAKTIEEGIKNFPDKYLEPV